MTQNTTKQAATSDENQVLAISLPKEMKKNLKLYAIQADMSVSQLMRQIIREQLPAYQTDKETKK